LFINTKTLEPFELSSYIYGCVPDMVQSLDHNELHTLHPVTTSCL